MNKVITFNPLRFSRRGNYWTVTCKKFLDDFFYNSLKKELTNFSYQDNSLWKEVIHTDKTVADKHHKVLGGGYDGDTVEIFSNLAEKYNLDHLNILIKELNTQKFLDYITSSIKTDKGKFKLVSSKYKQNFFDRFSKNKCLYLNLKLSCYPSGSGIALHRDNQRKYIGMLLYLGFTDNIKRDYGGTQFFSDENLHSSFSNQLKNHETHDIPDLIKIIDFKPNDNSFIGFEVNDHSWHRVDPFELKDGVYRINIQINFMRARGKTLFLKIFDFFLNEV